MDVATHGIPPELMLSLDETKHLTTLVRCPFALQSHIPHPSSPLYLYSVIRAVVLISKFSFVLVTTCFLSTAVSLRGV
jgi:hypothetical protein